MTSLNALVWRTSTYSSDGENCVEIAPAWRTSSYSSDGENCVEVAPTPDVVLVRHSKHPDAGTITFPFPSWSAFVRAALDNQPNANGVASITTGPNGALVTCPDTGVKLDFDPAEWSAFLSGAADGEFAFTS